MGGVLTVTNDGTDDLEISQANIFTPGQGICLQRLEPKYNRRFQFDNNLGYGSWYDLQLVCRSKAEKMEETEAVVRYLFTGIYLRRGLALKITEITSEKYLDLGAAWQCGGCKKTNIGNVAMCEFCFTNKSQKIITVLSHVPVIGLPFQITNTVLQCGKAAQSNVTADKVEAGLNVAFAIVDIIAAPFIVGALVKIPAKVTLETGIKLTAKTVFTEAGNPLLKEVGREMGKGGIITMAKLAKGGFAEFVKNAIDH